MKANKSKVPAPSETHHLLQVIKERPPISYQLLTETLEAMHWCISPYQGSPDLDDYPHIVNLALCYNKIIYAISPHCKHDFIPFDFKP
jgi:hypothetical protein